MGINDLLKLYHPVIRNIHISEFKGQKCAVDMMVWLYRGVYASLNNESHTEKSDLYLNFPLKMLSLLKNNDIDCIAVFDGRIPPAKYHELEHRNHYKENSLELAKNLMSIGKSEESKKIYKRTLKIKSRMINTLIEILKKMDIEVIVAPYEADAQISFLYQTHQIDFAISEDSDLIPYGITKIGFKLDSCGNLNYLDLTQKDYPNLSGTKDGDITKFLLSLPRYKLVQFCVLLGCDYLPSPKGLGVKSCYKLFSEYDDIDTVVSMMKYSGKYQFENDDIEEYKRKAKEAASVFYLQTVYDNRENVLKPLTSLRFELRGETIGDLITKNWLNEIYTSVKDKDYYGKYFEEYEDYCNGNIDIKRLTVEKKKESSDVITKYYNRFFTNFKYVNCKLKKFQKKEEEYNYLTIRPNLVEVNIDEEIDFLKNQIGSTLPQKQEEIKKPKDCITFLKKKRDNNELAILDDILKDEEKENTNTLMKPNEYTTKKEHKWTVSQKEEKDIYQNNFKILNDISIPKQ